MKGHLNPTSFIAEDSFENIVQEKSGWHIIIKRHINYELFGLKKRIIWMSSVLLQDIINR